MLIKGERFISEFRGATSRCSGGRDRRSYLNPYIDRDDHASRSRWHEAKC